MKRLPVPDLEPTLDCLLGVVRPIVDDDQFAATKTSVEEFAAGDGPRCQQDLLAFADEQHAQGESWFSRVWLSGYLGVRTPLPLTSNVGFQLRMDTESTGLDRAAEIAHRLAAVHLAHVRGDLTAEVSPRGDAICPRQRCVLAGGIRHPHTGEDQIRPGSASAANREIAVLVDGAPAMVRISDADGYPLPVDAIRTMLQQVLTDTTHDPQSSLVTGMTYLGSEVAAGYLDDVLAQPPNQAGYQRLVDALFTLTLTDRTASVEEHLQQLTFGAGHVWAYKPINYAVNLSDGFFGMHLEHSMTDGATLKDAVTRAQAQPAAAVVEGTGASQDVPAPEFISWQLPAGLSQRLEEDVAGYRRTAERYRTRLVKVNTPVPDGLPFRVSDDAAMQWIMMYAQLATYGRVRSSYEAVDMREYQAGRTECLRAVTAPAVELAHALLEGSATVEQVKAAGDKHKEWVIAAKTGQAMDRHLLGLQCAADRLGLTPALFTDPGRCSLHADFLSTTSLGDTDQIVRAAFAPTSPGGIAAYYTPVEKGYEFSITVDDTACELIEEFLANLVAGTGRLAALLAGAAGQD